MFSQPAPIRTTPGAEHTGNFPISGLVTSDMKKLGNCAKYQVQETFTYEECPRRRWSPGASTRSAWRRQIGGTPNSPSRSCGSAFPCCLKSRWSFDGQMLRNPCRCQDCLGQADDRRRLHFEPGTLSAIEVIRSGKLGEVHSFAQPLDPSNHRAQSGDLWPGRCL